MLKYKYNILLFIFINIKKTYGISIIQDTTVFYDKCIKADMIVIHSPLQDNQCVLPERFSVEIICHVSSEAVAAPTLPQSVEW